MARVANWLMTSLGRWIDVMAVVLALWMPEISNDRVCSLAFLQECIFL